MHTASPQPKGTTSISWCQVHESPSPRIVSVRMRSNEGLAVRQIKSEDHEGRPGQKQVVLRSKREAGLKQASTTYIAAKVSGDTCVFKSVKQVHLHLPISSTSNRHSQWHWR